MTFKQWVIDLFKDERGSTSIKPVIAFLGALFLCGTMLANSFTEEHFKPADSLVNAVAMLAFGALGLTSFDKFTSLKNKTAEATKPAETESEG